MDNNKGGGWTQGREVERAGVLGTGREKRQKTVLEQRLKKTILGL